MTTKFPHRYWVELARRNGATVLQASPRPPIRAGAPLEFGGSDTWWSPEHLLLAAVELCFSTTLDALARRRGVAIADFRSSVEGVLDKTKDGLAFTSIRLDAEVHGDPADAGALEELLTATTKHCIVANALKVPVEHTWRIHPPSAATIGS